MQPAFELAAFTVRADHEAAMLAERPGMIDALQSSFPGLLAAWLTKRDDGSWLDIILWRTRTEAQAAAEHAHEIPAARSWFQHIAESHGIQHVTVTGEHVFAPVPRRPPL